MMPAEDKAALLARNRDLRAVIRAQHCSDNLGVPHLIIQNRLSHNEKARAHYASMAAGEKAALLAHQHDRRICSSQHIRVLYFAPLWATGFATLLFNKHVFIAMHSHSKADFFFLT